MYFSSEVKTIWEKINPDTPILLALLGQLGSGKTTFTQEFAKALNISKNVSSPSFIIHKEYKINKKYNMLHHIDFYRIQNINEVKELQIDKMLKDKNIIVIEWADKFANYVKILAKKHHAKLIWINFEHLTENQRKITIEEEKV